MPFTLPTMDVSQVGVNVATTRKKTPLSLGRRTGCTSGVQFYDELDLCFTFIIVSVNKSPTNCFIDKKLTGLPRRSNLCHLFLSFRMISP